MKTKYKVIIKDKDDKIIDVVMSSSFTYAYKKFRKLHHNSNESVIAAWKGTVPPELLRITTISELKKGDYFVTVNKDGKCGKTVYVKGNYDHSYEKYECYKFHDVNSIRYFHRDTEVTDEMTF